MTSQMVEEPGPGGEAATSGEDKGSLITGGKLLDVEEGIDDGQGYGNSVGR